MKNINYIYYGLLFFLIITTSSLNLYFIENLGFKEFFLLDIIIQSFLEILILIFIGYLIKKYLNKKCFMIFTSFLMLIFLIQIIDFLLIKTMDLPFYEAFHIIINETYKNFTEMLNLTNIPSYLLALFILILTVAPLLGYYFYKTLKKLSKNLSLNISLNSFFILFFSAIIALFLWDHKISNTLQKDLFYTYQKTLPFKKIFFKKNQTVSLKLKTPKITPLSKITQPKKKPNIFIFIAESVRKDHIKKENAPFLKTFSKENISSNQSFSNSNNTPCSWFSIFYSKYPLYWNSYKNMNLGSTSLNILKKIGYNIHVYTSSYLKYYKMNKILFGKNKNLLTSFYYPKIKKPYKKDLLSLQKALIDVKKNKNNSNVYIIFLESTHFTYSFPSKESQFIPYKKVKLFQHFFNKKLNILKNRYKNSISFIDYLFSNFIQELKKNNLYDDSIIVFTSDHGEEFFEKGCLFHASHLIKEQTEVPIFYKFDKKFKAKKVLTSHVDIFPTIFDYLKIKHNASLDGTSIFSSFNKPIFCSRYRGGKNPNRFFIFDGENKIICRLQKKKLQMLFLKDNKDNIKKENKYPYLKKAKDFIEKIE